MRWFKHMTCSLRDPKIAQLIALKGMAGFGSYWAVLETIAEHVDERGITSASYPLRHWQRVLGMFHARHAFDMLRTMAELNLITLKINSNTSPTSSELAVNFDSTSPQHNTNFDATSCQQPGNLVFVDMPNILKFRDEWTRKRGKTPEPLRSKEVDTDTEKEQKKKIPFVEGDEPLRLATYLFNCIRKNLPDFKQPDLQAWARHVDLMLRIDKREVEHVRQVIAWAQSDNQPRGDNNFCWANNILSTAKLREKFDQLTLKMAAGPGKKDELAAWAAEQRKKDGRP
ncbi:MAG: hypothetical protein RDU24_08960 [Humidesulfovibrio sp.]|uniref:hypothetical protein n=1 Tax=Humidesulfovibrio sp. TaxID=2910988 RepID=UPI0027FA4C21|nr:hypothetical protein [Humidesulfovibrio sp.]MDQ7835498.1 hypothetical protein [Humidesulfovibrio sp.]